MRSLLDVRLGSQTPTIQHSPPDVHSLAAAEEAIELADAYGVADGCPLSESQKITLRLAGGERVDGSWAATRIADFGPRQGTGKNDKIAAWELAHLLLFGTELIIHTAHEFQTANEAFLRLVATFDAWDDLRRKVRRIRYANGEQGIELMSGQRLKYRARTGGSGRGFAKAGLLVYDEAQHLAREHTAASGPTKMANPNAQTWYAGSGGLATSAVAWDLRKAALAGTGGRLAYTEMTGECVSLVDGRVMTVRPDPEDRDVWYATIPGLGRWVTEEGVAAQLDELGELFPREILCVWESQLDDGEELFPASDWKRAADPSSMAVSRLSLAASVMPDRSSASVALAGRRADGLWHVELYEQRAGAEWVVGWIAEKAARNRLHAVLVDELAGLTERRRNRLYLKGTQIAVTSVSTEGRDMAKAWAGFHDAVTGGSLRHTGQPEVNRAIRQAVTREAGGGKAVSQRSSSSDITPLTAETLALWGAQRDDVKRPGNRDERKVVVRT